MRYFFTSDYHLGHTNIIKYCNRPFISLKHMDTEIIRRHNERVKPEDIVFHIGDFCFRNYSNKDNGIRINASYWESLLNGKIIHIKGNHDRNNSTKTIIENLVIKYCRAEIYLVHDPDKANTKYSINFVGHVHDKWKVKKFKSTTLINVGVDVNNFYPQTMQELLKIL